jgi:ParB family chromosome partitioning protein
VIATGTNDEVQGALVEAYEKGDLRGAKLEAARRIIAMRLKQDQRVGKNVARKRKLTAALLVQEYEQHIKRQRAGVVKLNAVTHRLMILSTAMKRLLKDENFVTLLRAESLQDIPSHLAGRIG